MNVPGVKASFVYVLRRYPQLSQTFVRNEIVGLRALGHDVHVISLRDSDTAHVDPGWAGPYERWSKVVPGLSGARALGWWLVHHPVRTVRMLAAAYRLGMAGRRRLALLEVPAVARRLAARGPVAAVHTHFAWPLSLEPTILLARLLGARSSVTTHAVDIYLPAPTLPRVLRLVDAMVTVCRYNVGELARTGLWPTDRPEPAVVPCGVDVPETVPTPPEERCHRVVSVGRLVEKKGFDDLVAAMAEVVRSVPEARLEIIGEGPLREELEQQIADLGLGAVVSLRGAAPHAEVLDTIARADVFALACQVDSRGDSDAMPVVLREAMARAVPVVTTDVAGIGESVDAAVGWLVRPRDVGALSWAISEAFGHRGEADERGRLARDRIIEEASATGTARAMAALLSGAAVRRTPSITSLRTSEQSGGGHRYSVVTVVYEGDLPLLHLQARSLVRHAAPGLFKEVIVIDNTRGGLPGRGVRRLLRDYGPLAPLVRVVRAGSLAALPPMTGWWSQQVLKLAVAETITTDRYLILDAKNLAVDVVDLDFLQVADGRSRLAPSSFRDHPLRPKLETTLGYLGVDPDRWLDDLGSTVTPFVMETALVRDLAAGIERSSGRTLAEEMIEYGLTEFFLYQGSIVASGRSLAKVHAMERVRCPAVWPKNAGLDVLTGEIAEARDRRAPIFTVHQRALIKLDPTSVAALADFWVERGLFTGSGAAQDFVRTFRRSWRAMEVRRSARRAMDHPIRGLLSRIVSYRHSSSENSPKSSRSTSSRPTVASSRFSDS